MCVPGAKPGQPGYCDPNLPKYEDLDYEDYENWPDDVSSNAAWGYCDKKCHVSASNLEANVLQEVKIPACFSYQ